MQVMQLRSIAQTSLFIVHQLECYYAINLKVDIGLPTKSAREGDMAQQAL